MGVNGKRGVGGGGKQKREKAALLVVAGLLVSTWTFTIIDTRVMHTLLSEDSLDRVFVLLSL